MLGHIEELGHPCYARSFEQVEGARGQAPGSLSRLCLVFPRIPAWDSSSSLGLHVAPYVHVPAGEFGRQPSVLALFAYGKRELAVRNDGGSGIPLLIEFDSHYLGRAQGVRNESSRVFAPFDYIYLFALQLADDILDANSP